LVFDFSSISDAVSFGRAIQDVRLCKKYKLAFIFVSFAKSFVDMRSSFDIEAFSRVLSKY
jgi:hypothetical protein